MTIQLVFSNRYLFRLIIDYRNQYLGSTHWFELVSRPLHLQLKDDHVDSDIIRYSIKHFYRIHKDITDRVYNNMLYNNNDSGNGSFTVLPIEAAINANNLDAIIQMHQCDLEDDEYCTVTTDTINLATASHVGLDIFKYLANQDYIVPNREIDILVLFEAINNNRLDIVEYIFDELSIETKYKDYVGSPISEAISNGPSHREIIKYLLGKCTLEPIEIGYGYKIRSTAVSDRAFQRAVKTGNIELVELVLQAGWFLPKQHDTLHVTLISAILSNNIDMINYVLSDQLSFDTDGNSQMTEKIKIKVEMGDDVTLSDKVLDFIINDTRCLVSISNVNLDPYIAEKRVDAIERLLQHKMAEETFDPNRALESNDILETLVHLVTVLKVEPFEKMSIHSTTNYHGDKELMRFTQKYLCKKDNNDRDSKQCQMAATFLWTHTIKKEESSTPLGYYECLEQAHADGIITTRHIMKALRYWDGDQDLFKVFPALHQAIIDMDRTLLLEAVESKFKESIDSYSMPEKDFDKRIRDRPWSIFKGAMELIEMNKEYFKKDCLEPIGDWACRQDNLDLVKYIYKLDNPRLFTPKSIRVAIVSNKSLNIIQFLFTIVFPETTDIEKQLSIPILPKPLVLPRFSNFTYPLPNNNNNNVSKSNRLLLLSRYSNNLQLMIPYLQGPCITSREYFENIVFNRSHYHVTITHDHYWTQVYPLYVLLLSHNKDQYDYSLLNRVLQNYLISNK
ncbi:hypothetical protein DFA_01217 [Cavenderia fasciculata]|uniref:Ankyrin repeat-containing protein n=1 Tax=Cavenderia fasciculata TaxID=261658 RepID=F4PRJ6_CACFS|nr:uncharacterized protein DFA_01217 [Cavenderia fasciculata]EGG21336.1 hypothetical protein DFA_01217 [Cavenderia fasciculata]|eukprot:XP_004359186.1 hypothetical protein DFA_01217 [Cavenderia fasciculata]